MKAIPANLNPGQRDFSTGEDNKIVGIEILNASKHLNLEGLLPVEYEAA